MNDMGMRVVTCGEYHVAVFLHTRTDPPMPQWKEAMSQVAEVKQALEGNMSKFLTLAVSDGGAPNTVQRGEYTALVGTIKTAGVTSQLSNRLIRGIATALFWLNPNFKAFPPDQFNNAINHLEIGEHRAKIIAALIELQQKMLPTEILGIILEGEKTSAARP